MLYQSEVTSNATNIIMQSLTKAHVEYIHKVAHLAKRDFRNDYTDVTGLNNAHKSNPLSIN